MYTYNCMGTQIHPPRGHAMSQANHVSLPYSKYTYLDDTTLGTHGDTYIQQPRCHAMSQHDHTALPFSAYVRLD